MKTPSFLIIFVKVSEDPQPTASSQVQLQRIVAAGAAHVHGCYRVAR